MNTVLRRWLFFAGAALLSAVTLIWMFVSEVPFARSLSFIVVSVSFIGAILLTRKVPSIGEGFSYGFMMATLFLVIFGTCARILQENEIEPINAIAFLVFGPMTAVITGAGYGHFLGKDHPPMAELAILAAAAVIIPYGLYGILYMLGFDAYPFHYGLIIIAWQLTIGYAFSKDTSEDVLGSKYLNTLIGKIGKNLKT